MSRAKAKYDDLRCVVLLFGRRSDFRVPECESDEWASTNAMEVLVQAGVLDGTFYHGGQRLTELGEGIYQRLVIGHDSPTLREIANGDEVVVATIPKRRWFAFSLRTLFIVLTLLCAGLAYHLNWIRQRQQVREWLTENEHSWYAPSLVGARVQASAPWGLRLLGEQGIVGIGMDVDQFAGPVPFSPETLKRLFPEARVDFSREGVWVDP